jgi:hypothetical protein
LKIVAKPTSAKAAFLPYSTCCHAFRATRITTDPKSGGDLDTVRDLRGRALIATLTYSFVQPS